MEALGVASSVIAVVELSAKIASLCLQYSKDVKNAKDNILKLRHQVTELENASKAAQNLLDSPNGKQLEALQQLRTATQNSQLQLQALHKKLRPSTPRQAMSRLSLRSLKWPFQSEDIEKIIEDIRHCTQAILLALQIDQTTIILNLDRNIVLKRLHAAVAAGASFDSHAEDKNSICLPNTRVEILDKILEWAKSPHTESLFWLNGMAGTGKSTISRTIARSLAGTGHLGGSFFFKRGEIDRESSARLFTTVASQLAARNPVIASHIESAIVANPGISDKGLQEQFDKLILQPLAAISPSAKQGEFFVIVVDALDECKSDDEVKRMIHLFGRAKGSRLKVFATSRPELPIRLGFSDMKDKYQYIILHEISKPVISHDLSVFLKHELAIIRENYNKTAQKDRQLDEDWPGQSSIDALVAMAIPLFIFAATVCRFLADYRLKNPREKLQKVLAYQTNGQASKLDATYLPVLDQQIAGLSEREQKEVLQEFQLIVGSIVLLASPLSTSTLAKLLNVSRDAIDDRLNMLHSVLNIPLLAESPVRLLHLSFRDFLVDPERQGQSPFWINKAQAHADMAANCLRIMKDSLQEDICHLRPLGLEGGIIDRQEIDKVIPAEVQYACLNWVFHLKSTQSQSSNFKEVFQFLKQHFLHWVEVLSLIQRAPESIRMIRGLQTVLPEENSQLLFDFLNDCLRFLSANISTISIAPLQIYSSALIFAPHKSIIRKLFQRSIPKWIQLQPKTENNWDHCIQKLEGHSSSVLSVAFSHDSSLVASASYDKTVRLWHADTGECVQTLEGHSSSVLSVAFSHDSSLVASASVDNTVRLWHADTGECVQTLEGHSSIVLSVAFSHDSSLVASASYDNTVRLWHADTGECVQTLKGHSSIVQSVAFSYNSSLVASASYDKTVRLWHADTGECVQTLEGHSSIVQSVAFSHDSSLVASASYDNTVRLWHADTGKCVQTLEGHSSIVQSVAFSHDSSLVASASDDSTVRLWHADTGECVQTLNTGSVSCLSFKPEYSQLLTDIGAFAITETKSDIRAVGYGLSKDGCWITWNGNYLLWLPVEYRPVSSVVRESTVVIGSKLGRVLVMAFSDYY